MAKIRTNENEEQLSVIAQLLSETQKSITELNKTAYKLGENQEVYRRFYEKSIEASSQQIKAVTSQEINAMSKISSDIQSLQNSSIQKIEKALQIALRSEEHTSELQSRENLVCRLLLEKKNKKSYANNKEMNKER